MRSVVTVASVTVGFAVAFVACAHPPPRGPVATTKATARAASCRDEKAPYLAELCGMDEPPLSVAGPEAYRFVWTRHLYNPVAVRVTRAGSDVAVVTVEADVHDPSARRRHEFVSGGEAWTTLQTHLAAADFWNLAGDPEEDERGLDGADWVLEGRRGGLYHSVIRWEPKPGPFRAACEDLVRVSGLSFPAEIR